MSFDPNAIGNRIFTLRTNGEDEEAHLCRQTAGNKAGKIAVLCQLTAVARCV